MSMNIPSTKLSPDVSIPNIGFGLWKNKDEAECIETVGMALNVGYRHFDTAQAYDNEQFLAAGLKKAGMDRKDVFITTKIKVENFLRVEKSFAKSLENLQTDYVDLLLLHFPVTVLRHSAWKKIEAIHKAGQAKTIGVSNYMIRHLEH